MYNLLQENPGLFVIELLFSLLLTLIGYGIFPFIFSKTRKGPITKKKFTLICFGVNLIIMLGFTVLNSISSDSSGGASATPYILWTAVFSATGVKTLRKRGILDSPDNIDYKKTDTHVYGAANNKPCPNCGQSIPTGSEVCSSCGFSFQRAGTASDAQQTSEQKNTEETLPPIVFCRKCGYKLIEGSRFCSKCGTTIMRE